MYKPLGDVPDGPSRRYQARDPDNEFVEVHEVPSQVPEFEELARLVEDARRSLDSSMLEVIQADDGVVVVTPVLPQMVDLADWLRESISSDADQPGSAVGSAPEEVESVEEEGGSNYIKIPFERDAGKDEPEKTGRPPSYTEQIEAAMVQSYSDPQDRPPEPKKTSPEPPSPPRVDPSPPPRREPPPPPREEAAFQADQPTPRSRQPRERSITEELQQGANWQSERARRTPIGERSGRRREELPPIRISLREYINRLES
jgi:hypothetical protein